MRHVSHFRRGGNPLLFDDKDKGQFVFTDMGNFSDFHGRVDFTRRGVSSLVKSHILHLLSHAPNPGAATNLGIAAIFY